MGELKGESMGASTTAEPGITEAQRPEALHASSYVAKKAT